MINIETDRLLLRNVAERDVMTIHEYRNSEKCSRYQRWQTKDYAGIRRLVSEHSHDELSGEGDSFIAIALKSTDEIIGEVIVMPREGTFSLGFTLHFDYHRRGFAFEALSVITELLHRSYPDFEFISFVDPSNDASRALHLKLGYECFGYLGSKSSLVFGKWVIDATKEEIAHAIGS